MGFHRVARLAEKRRALRSAGRRRSRWRKTKNICGREDLRCGGLAEAEVELGRELGAHGFAGEDGEGVRVGGVVFAGDELGGGAGVEWIGEGDESVAADVFEFIAVEADGLARGWIIFESGDDE